MPSLQAAEAVSPATPNPSIMRRWVTFAGLLLVTVVVGLSVLELSFGSWLRSNPWERALALNIVVNRRIVYDATDLYENGGPVISTRDQYGLRGHYGNPKDISILTIGGSTTDQRYIGDGLTWQDELERALRDSGKNVRVANAGVDGHSTFGHLASYRYWFPLIPNLRPAYTVLYVGINDFFVDRPHAEFEGTADGSVTLTSRIKADSALYRLYSLARGTWLARRVRLAHKPLDVETLSYTETPNLRDHEAVARARFRGFENRMAALLQRVRESGSAPVCVTSPTLFYRRNEAGRMVGVDLAIDKIRGGGTINGVDYFFLRLAQDTVMLSLCRAVHAAVIDLASGEWENEDFYDLMHTTPLGAKKVGQRIAEAMKTLPF